MITKPVCQLQSGSIAGGVRCEMVELSNGDLLTSAGSSVKMWSLEDNKRQRLLPRSTFQAKLERMVLVDQARIAIIRLAERGDVEIKLLQVKNGECDREWTIRLWGRVEIWQRELGDYESVSIPIWNEVTRELHVWSLHDERLSPSFEKNVVGTFEDGLYIVETNDEDDTDDGDDAATTNKNHVWVMNYWNVGPDGQHLPLGTLPTNKNGYSSLIQLDNGNFATHSKGEWSIKLWSQANGSCIRTLWGHTRVEALLFLRKRKARDGFLSAGGLDGRVIGWSSEGDCLFVCRCAEHPEDAVANGLFELSNAYIACTDNCGRLTLWDPDSV